MTTVVPPAAPPSRKPTTPGQPWSHLETTHLIDAYEQKWYSLKRGQLKAHQWEEVAAAVASRCNFPEPSKTGTQCRHKVEKLRKRYRSERNRPNPSLWPYFDRMDRMERGPLPISIKPPVNSSSDEEDDDDDDVDEEKFASINGILRNSEDEEEEEEEEEEQEEEEGEGEGLLKLAKEVRRFGEGFVRMEKRRMEMMREIERDWMEMEAKRAEMVIESQRCIVESIVGAFSTPKKAKKSQDFGE